MDYTWLIKKPYKEILKILYDQNRKNDKKDDKEYYYVTNLAKKLNKKRQAISEYVKTLIKNNIIKVVKEEAGPNRGRVRYLDLTENGLFFWKVLATPSIDELKKVIIDFKELYDRDPEPEVVAAKLGKNPQNKDVMDLIYAVLAMPEVRNYQQKIPLA
ncbi:MAG: hypothetical protein JSW06_01720 [Thermoplasmatales archaeon]|nr:MAG: hypothetical protein JSW06_01720 [Thermoplasmatales archaeon]